MTNPMSQSDKIREAALKLSAAVDKSGFAVSMESHMANSELKQLLATPAPEAGTEGIDSNGFELVKAQEENAELKRMFARVRHDVAEALDELDEDYDSAMETLKAVAKFDEAASLESQLSRPQGSEAVKALIEAVEDFMEAGPIREGHDGTPCDCRGCASITMLDALAQLKKEQG